MPSFSPACWQRWRRIAQLRRATQASLKLRGCLQPLLEILPRAGARAKYGQAPQKAHDGSMLGGQRQDHGSLDIIHIAPVYLIFSASLEETTA